MTVNTIIEDFEKMKKQAKCPNQFRCVRESWANQQLAKYYAQNDLMECIECESKKCDKSVCSALTTLCYCELRKFIAINFEKLYSCCK